MSDLEKNIIGNPAFVQSLIPQRAPFVMVDTLFECTQTSLVSGFLIPAHAVFCQEGFFNESGLIEHMAQSVALHTGYQFYLKNQKPPTGYIGSLKNIQINSLPKVNDFIKTTVTILQEFAGITLVEVVTQLNQVVIAQGQMKTVIAA